ncbi:hypothetical protein FACS1894170_08780 [Planctomycetales bacterium]|nr:hypothetical protein FACS1894170_08780 [Planctomycetales bacterium]
MLLRLCVLAVFALSVLTDAAELSLQKTPTGYEVLIDGQIFAGYLTDYGGSPIVYPIVGPTGKKMTRDFPMSERNDDTEEHDHFHQRSLWFTHESVNGLDFWTADDKTKQTRHKIVHRKFSEAEVTDNTAVLQTENDWLGQDGVAICSDVRTIRFGLLADKRFIDFDITVTALVEPVVFGDIKDGTFGLRVPGTMAMTAVKRNPAWGGHILNAEGLTDTATWGKRSAWVDYYGPVDGETLGIAILNHPSSLRYPTYWHVRDYGLFAANPFGVHAFTGQPKHTGDLTLHSGEQFSMRHRVVLHKGTAKDAEVKCLFDDYRKQIYCK